MKFFLTFFLLVIIYSKPSSSQIDGFMGACSPDVCKIDQGYFNSKEYKLRLYKLFSAGIPQILWDHFREKGSTWSLSGSLNVSSQCQQGLKSVWNGIEEGDEWAFKCELKLRPIFSSNSWKQLLLHSQTWILLESYRFLSLKPLILRSVIFPNVSTLLFPMEWTSHYRLNTVWLKYSLIDQLKKFLERFMSLTNELVSTVLSFKGCVFLSRVTKMM